MHPFAEERDEARADRVRSADAARARERAAANESALQLPGRRSLARDPPHTAGHAGSLSFTLDVPSSLFLLVIYTLYCCSSGIIALIEICIYKNKSQVHYQVLGTAIKPVKLLTSPG